MKQSLLTIIQLLTSFWAFAQLPHPPCVPPSFTYERTECPSACSYCDFDGYTGSTDLTTDLSNWIMPCDLADFTGIGFVAGGNSITITATPSNCLHGDGLQMVIHADCIAFPTDPYIDCDPGAMGGGNTPVQVSISTVPGNFYSIAIGGYAGDQCNFTITVSPPGAAQAPTPGNIPGDIEGGDLCPGGTATYTVPYAPNSGGYIWTAPAGWLINGLPSPQAISGPESNSVQITAGLNPGSGQVCAMAVNACHSTGPSVCRTISVMDIPLTILEPGTICHENLPYLLPWGDLAYNAGSYSKTLPSYLGCDSVVNQQVLVFNNYTTDLGTKTICEGDAFTACGQDFFNEGIYALNCQTYQGCDSTVKFSLAFALAPVAQINGGGTLDCVTSSIVLSAEPSPVGTIFQWHNAAGQMLGSTGSYTVTTAGTYYLDAVLTTNGTQCIRSDSIVILKNLTPPSLNAADRVLTCAMDTLQLTAMSNALNPAWSWAGPAGFSSPLANPAISIPGTYTVTVTSAGNAGCTASATLLVTKDTIPPVLNAEGGTLTCSDTTVPITVSAVSTLSGVVWSGPNGFFSDTQSAQVSEEGTYTVVATSSVNGCTTSDTALVVLNTTPPGASALGGTLTCTTPALTLNGQSASNTVFFAWTGPNNFSSTQQNPIVSTAGDYILTVTDSTNHCTSSISAIVSADQNPPVVSASADTLTCAHDSLMLNGNATLPSSYAWSGPNAFNSMLQNPQVGTSGEYTLIATAANGCADTTLVMVAEDFTLPGAHAWGDTIDCNQPQAIISVNSSSGISYAWTGPDNFSASVQNPTVLLEGTYIVTVLGANGCSSTSTAVVELNTEVPTLLVLVPDTLTCTQTSIDLQATITTSLTTVQSLSWTGPGTFASNQEDPTVTSPGTYTLMVGTTNGCSATAQVSVNEDIIIPDISIESDTLDCVTTSFNLNGGSATPNVSFAWTGPNNFTAQEEDPLIMESGTYILTVSGANGCTATAETLVEQDIAAPDLALASTNDLNCAFLNSTLSGTSQTNGLSYAWTGPNNFSAHTASTSVNEPGIYHLKITAPNGCFSLDSINIAQDFALPDASALGDTIDCTSGQAVLTGNSATPDVMYAWDGPNNFMSDQQTPEVSQAGTYTLTVTGTNGCSSVATAIIEENMLSPEVVLSGGGTLSCIVQNINISGSISTIGASGIWTGPNSFTSTQADITIDIPGIYTYTVTAQNGCVLAPTYTVLADLESPEDVVTTGGMLHCTLASVQLSGNSSTNGATYLWTGPGNFNSNLPDPVVTNPGIYTLVVSNPVNGCTVSATAEVTQDPAVPNISVVSDSLTCALQTVTLNASTTTSGATFAWTGPDGFMSTLEDPGATVPGEYTVIITAPNSCTTSATVSVIPDMDAPIISANGGTINCLVPGVNLDAVANIPVDWQWSGPSGFNSTQPNPLAILEGNYTVVATASNGCTGTSEVMVLADNQSPEIMIGQPGIMDCNTPELGLTVQTQGSGPFDYQWSTQDGDIASGANSPNPQVSEAGKYQVLVTNSSNGCTATQSVTVEQDPETPVGAVLQEIQISCFGKNDGSIVIDAIQGGTPPFVYSIDSQDFMSDAIYTDLTPGIHTLLVQDALGCEYQTTFELTEPDELTINLGPDTTIQLGEAILLSLSQNAVNLPDRVEQTIVFPADLPLDSLFVPVYSLNYRVTVVDSNGCEATDERNIEVDRKRHIYVPTVFNPSSALNSVLYLFSGQDVAEIESFQIYDRWGNRVFEQYHFQPNDPAKGWSGRYRGKEVNPGVFVYQAVVRFIDSEQELFRGDVTVFR